MDNIPQRFRPIIGRAFRDGIGLTTYHRLKRTDERLSADEIIWLFKEVDEKTLSIPWEGQIRSRKGLIARYNLYKNFFKKKKRRFDQGDTFDASSGGQECIDGKSKKRIATTMLAAAASVQPLTNSGLITLLNSEVVETNKRKGRVDPSFETVTDKTYLRFRKRHKVQCHLPDMCTEARFTACSCPRMSFMWYLICWTLSRFLPSTHKWNADASTYVFLAKGSGNRLCTLAPDSDMDRLLDIVDDAAEEETTVPTTAKSKKSRNAPTQLPFAIKVMQLCNAAGESGKPCVIIAVKGMPADAFFVASVVGLSWSNCGSESGTVYICKTRCGTAEMWADWHTRVCLPTIEASTLMHHKKKVK
jgi:hypothetical protein